jgi:peptidoglycan-synthase activator LpoB
MATRLSSSLAKRAALLGMAGLVALAGCSLLQRNPPIDERINLIAVMPIEREEPVDAPTVEDRPRLKAGAQRVVTAQIYSVLASSPKWRFVPDLTVMQALPKIDSKGGLQSRARDLGRAVGADAVLFGTVSRYKDREGGEYGARDPASVSFTLSLVSVATGKVLWTRTFDETQQSLSSNLFNWWQFWRGGPRWFTAEEFTRLGVERLLDDLSDQLGLD